MSDFTQSEIDYLIGCAKVVSEPPKREMKGAAGHLRNDAKLVASDGQTKGEFAVFMRRNEDFPENFSIGLIYRPLDGRQEITLLRCNGPHGDFNRSLDPNHPHCLFHIHHAEQSALDAGLAAESRAYTTSEYASYEEAMGFFLKTVNIAPNEASKHFSSMTQGSLFSE